MKELVCLFNILEADGLERSRNVSFDFGILIHIYFTFCCSAQSIKGTLNVVVLVIALVAFIIY